MVRYIVLLAVLSILLGGCVVVHSEKHVAVAGVAAAAALP
jgi:hypothetical protein